MVKYRGIEINIISQFDICKLPEFRHNTAFERNHHDASQNFTQVKAPSISPPPIYPTASCSVQIYPGSQVWLEYTIDGPHPPNAAYFFKLIVNDAVVAGWDCTGKHGFHGKMMYNLVSEGRQMFKRQALRFGDGLDNGEREDVVQVNVYRIGKRVRIRDIEEGVGKVEIRTARADGLRLTNSGLVEPGIRPRRYKYQLLDPTDVPYAAVQFHCRSIDFLEKQGLVPLKDCRSPVSARSSIMSQSSGNVQLFPDTSDTGYGEHLTAASPPTSSQHKDMTTDPPAKVTFGPRSMEKKDTETLKASSSMNRIPLTNSDDSLSVKTRDSIEELPTNVTRSPRSPASPKSPEKEKEPEIPPSPTRSPRSPRRRLTKKLTVNINGANFDVARRKRPLSPFTGGGALRKASLPLTAPAAVTEFGPTVEENFKAELRDEKPVVEGKVLKTTSEERGGRKLMSFLGRRITGQKVSQSNKSDGQGSEDASKCMPGRDNR